MLTKELNIDINREDDLVSLAQYYCNEKGGNRNNTSQLIMDEFNKQSEPTENQKILAIYKGESDGENLSDLSEDTI